MLKISQTISQSCLLGLTFSPELFIKLFVVVMNFSVKHSRSFSNQAAMNDNFKNRPFSTQFVMGDLCKNIEIISKSPYSFVHHKRVCRKRCPTFWPAVGGFPPWNGCLEEWQKLRLKTSNICPSFSQINSSTPAASHGSRKFKIKFKPLRKSLSLLKLAPFVERI